MSLHLHVVCASDVGLVRKNNQDSGYASPHLLVVADGMGGAAAGDLASAVAIDVLKGLDTPDLVPAAADRPSDDTEDTEDTEDTVIVSREPTPPAEQGAAGRNPLLGRFAAAINEANSRIADLVAADYSLEGMGTTVSGALFDGERLALAHIGDSRGYLLRGGRLEQLTHDHSWVQSLVDDGKISAEEAAYHPHRSLLLKVLNGQPANDPDLTTLEVQPGDRILFCSDGLCGMVEDDQIAALAATPDLDVAVTDLVDAALAAGGIDNITVILAEVLDGAEPTGAAGTVLGAAAEREIPAVPRRSATAAAAPDDDSEDEDEPAPDAAPSTPGAPPPSVDDESRYTPGPPAKRRLVKTLLVGLAILLVTAAGLGAGYAWTRTQYFVGASDGQVAIFTGLPDGVPGVSLSQVYEVQQLPVASLPPYYQAQVSAGIEVASLEAARATVEQLKDAAARCAPPRASPKPTPKATATPKANGSTTPSPTVTQSQIGPTAPSSAPATPAPTPTTTQGC